MGKFAHNVLKYTGFTAIEKFNRIVAANAGANYADDLAAIVRGEKTGLGANRNLAIRDLAKMLDVDTDTVVGMAKRGLSEDERMTVARRISDLTQFSAAKETLPATWTRSPYGKAFVQFKSFALRQIYFLEDEIIKPLVRDGNPAPLTRYLATGGTLSASSMYLKDLVTGYDRKDDSAADRIGSAAMSLLMLDTIGRVFGGAAKGDMKALLPPVASDIGHVGNAVYQTGKEIAKGQDIRWDKRLKDVERVVPAVRTVTNRLD